MEGQEVDWKRLVQLALLGSNDLANKLFVAGSTQTMYETLVKAKVPFPRLMTYFVAGVEFVGGSLVTVGFLSSLACVALLVDMLVAILTTNLSAMPKGLSPLNWLDDFLYLPEVLYVLFFIWLVCSGPGKFSADYWLAGTLLR
jgi:putative oxidoreductase